MKTLKILLLSIICFSLQGCPGEIEKEPDISFKIQNSSTMDIYFTVSHNNGNILIRQPEERDRILINGVKNEVTFNSFFQEGRLLTIFIYKKSTLDSKTWQEIKDQGLYDKRYDLTLEQLKALNYEIVYTGL
jgi:hypothetical protein